MADLFTWDTNKQNMVEPSQTLFNDGFAEDDIPTSGNINWLFHFMTTNRIPVGVILPFVGQDSAIPPGFLLANGSSIGNTGSGATFQDPKYEDLFTYQWTWDSAAVVSPGGKGASAAADWAANKNITISNLQGKTPAGQSNAGGSIFGTAPGATVGAETVTLTEPQLPVIDMQSKFHDPGHSHSATVYHRGDGSGNDAMNFNGGASDQLPTDQVKTGITIDSFGGGQPHTNVQPSWVCNFIIKW